MSVRKIKGRWTVDLRIERLRHRIASPENSRRGACAYESTLKQRAAKGEPLIPDPTNTTEEQPLFRDFSKRWYDTYVCVNNKPSEQKTKRITLNAHLVPFFGSYRLDKIRSSHIEEYKASMLKKGLSPKSVNNHLTIFRTCLRIAQDWTDLTALPRFKMLKTSPPTMDYLNPEECEKLLSVITDPFWYAMVLTAMKTGMRLGELKGLKWSDVNVTKKTLVVRRAFVLSQEVSPKSNRERHIPLTSDVFATIQKLPHDITYLFGRSGGRALHHETPSKTLHRYCEKAGIRHIGWHMLRHTFATTLASHNASLKAIQELLGHGQIQTTMRYAHLLPSVHRETISILEPQKNNYGH